jgi:ABC-type lipoprotein export system ATPase subunit
MFELEDLTFSYPGKFERVLNSITCTITAGDYVVVQGPSGVGKSTFLYLIGMLLNDGNLEGRVQFENSALTSLSEHTKSKIRKRRFGFLTQSSFLIPSMTCGENISLPLLVQGYAKRKATQIVNALVREADQVCNITQEQKNLALSHKLDKYPSEISGGQRKRLALLRSIVHSPEVLFADEPLSNLDAHTRKSIVQLLQKWKDGHLSYSSWAAHAPRTLIVVSHEDDLRSSANNIVFFDENGHVTQTRSLNQ